LIDIPTATSDAKTETGLAERLIETAKASRLGYRLELLFASLNERHVGFGHWEVDHAVV
jgi:hypothetical protein